ncbi:MAG TPA: hypothetical protein VN814_19695 [Caulobacteraceae bacterium]|nr:hypothetical protein [Caulobacteraceae bacterium]
MRTALILTALLALASPARAAFLNGSDPVPGHPGMTYLDLIKQAVPDLAENDADDQVEGHFAKNPRHIAGPDFQGDPPDSVTLGLIEDQRIKIGGKPRIALLVDLGPKPDRVEGLALLMLFTDTPHPKLLDDADVGVDKDSVLAEHAVLPLGPGDDALVTYSEHDDADLTMGGYVLISPVGDHLKLIQFMQLTSVVACGWSDMETTKFSTAPDPGRAYRKIEVRVSSRFRHTDPSCGARDVPKTHSTAFSAAYRWNAAAHRFETTSNIEARWKAYNDAVFK